MRTIFWAFLVAVCLLVQGSDAWADSRRLIFQAAAPLTQEQQRTLWTVIFRTKDSLVDADAHARFWSQFSEQDLRDWIAQEGTDQSPAAHILFFQRVETAFRQSVYETVAAGETIRTKELDKLRAEASGSRADPEDLWTQQFAHQDRILELVQLPDSKFGYRYPVEALNTWNEARRSLRQAELLLRSDWVEPQVTPWPYPALHLTLDWTTPLDMRPAVLCRPPCNAWSVRPEFNDQQALGIYYFSGVTRGSSLLESPEVRVATNLMSDLLYPYKVLEQSRADGFWQGYRSSVFKSSIEILDRPSYHVVRILFREDLQDELVIFGVSSRSMSEAERAFDQIEQAIHLN